MRVVVTGATGNVGVAVLRALARDDAVGSVVGIARRLPLGAFAKTEFVAADVARDELEPHFAGADCVVHLAWLIQPSHDRDLTRTVNVEGSRRVFETAVAAGVPSLVYASSVGAYSPGPAEDRVDESWPTGGIQTSFYSRDKAEVESILDGFDEQLRVVRLRPSLIFQHAMGTEVKRLFTGRLVPHRLVVPGRIPVVPDLPGLRFQATHADDVAEAYRLAIGSDVRGAFNIAAEPVLDAAALAALFHARRIRVPVQLARAGLALSWRARLQPTPEGWLDMGMQVPLLDTTRARTELGWAATRSAGETLLELMYGFHAGAGAPTPPLEPASGRA